MRGDITKVFAGTPLEGAGKKLAEAVSSRGRSAFTDANSGE